MYTISTKASITKLLVFTSVQVYVASSSTCPSQLAPLDQTFNICTKFVNVQVGCVTNVDSYSLYACTYVASVRDISTIVYHRQVLFVAVKKLLRFFEKTTNIVPASGVHKIKHNLLRRCAYNNMVLENYPYIPCVPGLITMWDQSTCPTRHLAPCSPTLNWSII